MQSQQNRKEPTRGSCLESCDTRRHYIYICEVIMVWQKLTSVIVMFYSQMSLLKSHRSEVMQNGGQHKTAQLFL